MGLPVADCCCMLLSTDWFAPYWGTLGLRSGTREQRLELRSRLQRVVKGLIGNAASYFEISFEPARLAATRESLLSEARSLLSAGDMELLERLVDRVGFVSASENSTLSLLHTICQLIASSSEALDRDMSKEGAELFRTHFSEQSDAIEIIYDAARESTTPWDEYVRSLTPDLPGFLPDFLTQDWMIAQDFLITWSRVRSRIAPKDLGVLIQLIGDTAEHLVEGRPDLSLLEES